MGRNERDTSAHLLEADDAPPWEEGVFARAEMRRGDTVLRAADGTLTRRGRPKADKPKRQLTLRLDSDIIDHFRASGPGWQSRINEVLKRATRA